MNRSSKLTEKMIGYITKGGSRARARRILSSALEKASRRLPGRSHEEILHTAMSNSAPIIEIKIKYVNGAAYQVPTPVPERQKVAKAIQKILEFARQETGRVTVSTLADALLASWKDEIPRPDRPRRAARLRALDMYRAVEK